MDINEEQFEKLFVKYMKKYFPKSFQKQAIDNKKVAPEIIELYKNNISRNLSNVELKALENFQNDFGKEIVLKAIGLAVINNGKNLNYIKTILKDWKEKELNTCEKVEKYVSKFTVKRKSSGCDNFTSYEQRNYNYDDLEKKLLGWEK